MTDRRLEDPGNLFWKELYERPAPIGWDYADPDNPFRDISKDRCRACGELRGSVQLESDHGLTFTECPDPCLGLLPGVLGACCGHGNPGCYIVGEEFGELNGPAAAQKMKELGGRPPPEAFLLDPDGGAE